MDAFAAFQQMLILVLVMAVGFVIRRLKVLDEIANAYLTKLLLRVTLPATLISGIAESTVEVPPRELVFLFAINILCFVVMALFSLGTPLVLRTERDERGVYAAMALFGNVSFMGLPLTYAFFGPDGIFYAVVHNIVFNILIFTLGMKLIAGTKAKLSLDFFFSPILLAAVSALLLFLLDIQLPYVMSRSLRLIGNVSTPAAMLLLGSILGAMHFREMFRGWRIYAVTFVRLVALPLVVFLLLTPFTLPPLFPEVMLMMVASPVAISSITFSIYYGVHQEAVGKGIFVSTLLSVVTIPVLLSLLF